MLGVNGRFSFFILFIFAQMKYARLVIPIVFGVLLLVTCSQPDQSSLPMGASLRPAPPPLDPALEDFLKDFHRYFEDTMILTMTPGAAVAIVKDSQVIFLHGYGVRAEGSPELVDEHTVFRIGSLSKGFTSILTGMMVEKHKLRWYDKVQDYIPDFNLSDPEQAKRLEIRHLLTQTTGLPYHAFSNLIERGFSVQYILQQYPLARLAGKEGEYFSYQNAAYSLIEPILQAATGKPFNELLATKIFQPMGMQDASSDYESMVNNTNHALPHRYRSRAWEADSITHRYYNFPAAGGVNASITDMSKWLVALLGYHSAVVPPSVLRDVFSPVIATGLERPTLAGFIDRDSAFYGKGWRILERGQDTLVYHAGFVNNFLSEIAFNRRDGIGICVLFNAPTPVGGKCISAFFRRWEKARKTMGKAQS